MAKIGVSRPDDSRDAPDLGAATVHSLGGVVEHTVFGEEFVDGRAAAPWIVFKEDVLKIAR